MQKVIGVTALQRRFRSVFDEGANDNVPYVPTRGSRPEAALIPYETFLQLLAFKEEEILAEFDHLATRIAGQKVDYAAAEVEEDVAAAVAEIRDNAPSH